MDMQFVVNSAVVTPNIFIDKNSNDICDVENKHLNNAYHLFTYFETITTEWTDLEKSIPSL